MKCRWCGEPAQLLYSQSCMQCFHVAEVIARNLEIVQKMLGAKNDHADVLAFHYKFGILYEGPPRVLPSDLFEFRRKFLHEELDEFERAHTLGDLVGAFDALIDLNYVSHGTAQLMGLPWCHGWKAVQAANMKKVRVASAADSKRGHASDVKKPPGWVGPEEELRRLIDQGRHCGVCPNGECQCKPTKRNI